MKNLSYIKYILLQMTFVASVFLITSCDEKHEGEDSKEVAEERNDDRFDDNDREDDAQFLVNAAAMNLKEIRLGKLAQQKGTTADVKELGKMMEDAHTRSQRDLTALAKSKGIAIPTTPTDDAKDAFNDLNDKEGTDFDKAYANKMVRGHNDAIGTFEDAAENSDDEDIRRWAKSSLPDLRSHLNHSIDCQKKFADLYLEGKN